MLTKRARLGEDSKVHPKEIRDIRQLDTHFQKKERGKIRWHVVDAEGVVLGRLAARTARVLMGKDSPDWTPFADHREGIIVINAEKVRLTGSKLDQKFYRHYTGYPGGLREIPRAGCSKPNPKSWSARPSWECFPRPAWEPAGDPPEGLCGIEPYPPGSEA